MKRKTERWIITENLRRYFTTKCNF